MYEYVSEFVQQHLALDEICQCGCLLRERFTIKRIVIFRLEYICRTISPINEQSIVERNANAAHSLFITILIRV